MRGVLLKGKAARMASGKLSFMACGLRQICFFCIAVWMASTERMAGPKGWFFRKRRSIISLFAALLVLGLDCLSPHSVVPLFGLAGSLGVGSSCIVFPGLLYLAHFRCHTRCGCTVVAVIVVLVGLVITLGSSAATLYNVIHVVPSNSSAIVNCTIEIHF